MGVGHLAADEDGVHALRDREHGARPAKALRHALLARDAVEQRGDRRARAHEPLHGVERLVEPGRLGGEDDQVDGGGIARGHGAHAEGLPVHQRGLPRVSRKALVVHHELDGVRPEVPLGDGAVEHPHRTATDDRHALDCHVCLPAVAGVLLAEIVARGGTLGR